MLQNVWCRACRVLLFQEYSPRAIPCFLGSRGWRSGESAHLPPDLTTNPGVDAICGLSLLLVLSFAPRGFSPGTPVFPSPQKPTLPNSNSTGNQVDEEPVRGCATSKSLFITYIFIYLLKGLHRSSRYSFQSNKMVANMDRKLLACQLITVKQTSLCSFPCLFKVSTSCSMISCTSFKSFSYLAFIFINDVIISSRPFAALSKIGLAVSWDSGKWCRLSLYSSRFLSQTYQYIYEYNIVLPIWPTRAELDLVK